MDIDTVKKNRSNMNPNGKMFNSTVLCNTKTFYFLNYTRKRAKQQYGSYVPDKDEYVSFGYIKTEIPLVYN